MGVGAGEGEGRADQRGARRDRAEGRRVGPEVVQVAGRGQGCRESGADGRPAGGRPHPERVAVEVGFVTDLKSDDAVRRQLRPGRGRPGRGAARSIRDQVQIDDQAQIESPNDLAGERRPARRQRERPARQRAQLGRPEGTVGRVTAHPQDHRTVAADMQQPQHPLQQRQMAGIERERPVLGGQSQIRAGDRHGRHGRGQGHGCDREAWGIGVSPPDVGQQGDSAERDDRDQRESGNPPAAPEPPPQTTVAVACPGLPAVCVPRLHDVPRPHSTRSPSRSAYPSPGRQDAVLVAGT